MKIPTYQSNVGIENGSGGGQYQSAASFAGAGAVENKRDTERR